MIFTKLLLIKQISMPLSIAADPNIWLHSLAKSLTNVTIDV